jgi:hypothetical protein
LSTFPWTSNGITFRTRRDLERTIESVAGAGTKAHLEAAHTLLNEAKTEKKLSTDQCTEIRERLHL